MGDSIHTPVLPSEVLAFLAIEPGMTVVDGTLGGGGHTRLLADAVGPAGRVIALDRDPAAIARGARELAGMPVRFAQANFCDVPEVLDALEVATVDRVLLDVGLSSDQLADDTRGFSFESDGPLDLRFDPTEGEPAWRMVNRLRPETLADIIYEFGEERFSRRIARRIADTREREPIRTSRDLARIVVSAVPRQKPPSRIHPATRTFQALRIAVNQELKSLRIALERIPARLAPGGRLAVISFHSLEDRLVKKAFRNRQGWEPLTRSPIEAAAEEVARNPRSRSAKLRVASVVGDALVTPWDHDADGRSEIAIPSLTSDGRLAVDLVSVGRNGVPVLQRWWTSAATTLGPDLSGLSLVPEYLGIVRGRDGRSTPRSDLVVDAPATLLDGAGTVAIAGWQANSATAR